MLIYMSAYMYFAMTDKYFTIIIGHVTWTAIKVDWQAKTSLSTFLLLWMVDLYLSLAMSNQLNLIECCTDLKELNFFVLSETWKTNPEIRNAIMAQYNRLDPNHSRNFN